MLNREDYKTTLDGKPLSELKAVDNGGTDLEIFSFVHKEKASALIFQGRKTKPIIYTRYQSEDIRNQMIVDLIKYRSEVLEQKKLARKARSAGHSLSVGDILNSSWGYDQTNVNFYEVVDVPSKCFVVIQEIAKNYIQDGFMSGKSTPKPGEFLDRGKIRLKSGQDNYVKLDSSEYASPWNGKPQYQSSYA